ncbi:GlsB/YeaQ/YmgE family stress response membrane protein [Altererythrobacter sp. FM1]|uniref:GlsB/YeaQ/YmgE family stress response membrane protein n=1 Tax=Tsuneonella flava TaxID=2055955 RepID=A0ABX7KAD0_9SPHN|nr:GlsB/YeaQ/YmgE family stress response membrane protein [Tsuneonella flava]QSB44959.1 GlsB/YeaQ/YmgE family stress response membrane protein [Tsuneonella flava]ROT96690.1 GlsB/YeaQ/YmgE family stress response membrane protein [Altererythrobacter sp. FM1]
MGLIVLLAVGGVLGWLASILICADNRQCVLANLTVGSLGALTIGWLTNDGSLFVGLTASSLLFSFVGTIGLLASFNILRQALARQHH